MLLPLHGPDGTPIWVNPDYIRSLEPSVLTVDGASAIRTGTGPGSLIHVRETPAEILAMLGLPGEKPKRCPGCAELLGEAPEYACLAPNCPALGQPPKHPAFQSLDDENRYLRGDR